MLRKSRFSLLAVSLTFAIVLAACGDDDKSDTTASGSDATTTTAPVSTQPGETTVPPETTAATPTTQAPVDASGIARDHIHLKYAATGESPGDLDVAVVGSKLALKIVSPAANQFALVEGADVTLCAWPPEPIECQRIAGGGETYSVAIQTFLDPLGANGPLAEAQGIQPVADRQVAGRTGKCSSGNVNGTDAEVCVDSELGVLLLMTAASGDFTLTELSGDVPDSLFALPDGATVKDADPGAN